MAKKMLLILALAVVVLPLRVSAATARVGTVINGDTLLLTNGEYVHLLGVKAPESQACLWKKSKRALQKLIEGKRIKLKFGEQKKTDTFGRTLAYVYVGNKFVNKRMIASGLAEVDETDTHGSHVRTFAEKQKIAQAKQRGIWVSCQTTEEPAPSALVVKILYANSTLDRGDRTWLQAETESGAVCSVDFSYPISSMEYGPPSDQTADASGIVYFEWRVDPTTPPGEWSVTVECTNQKSRGSATSKLSIYSPS